MAYDLACELEVAGADVLPTKRRCLSPRDRCHAGRTTRVGEKGAEGVGDRVGILVRDTFDRVRRQLEERARRDIAASGVLDDRSTSLDG